MGFVTPFKLMWSIHKPDFFRGGRSDAAMTYASIAMADPKAPMELKAMGPVTWGAQVSGITLALYTIDPMQLREGGWDDLYRDAYYGQAHGFLSLATDKASDTYDRFWDDYAQPAIDWWNSPPPTSQDLWYYFYK